MLEQSELWWQSSLLGQTPPHYWHLHLHSSRSRLGFTNWKTEQCWAYGQGSSRISWRSSQLHAIQPCKLRHNYSRNQTNSESSQNLLVSASQLKR